MLNKIELENASRNECYCVCWLFLCGFKAVMICVSG